MPILYDRAVWQFEPGANAWRRTTFTNSEERTQVAVRYFRQMPTGEFVQVFPEPTNSITEENMATRKSVFDIPRFKMIPGESAESLTGRLMSFVINARNHPPQGYGLMPGAIFPGVLVRVTRSASRYGNVRTVSEYHGIVLARIPRCPDLDVAQSMVREMGFSVRVNNTNPIIVAPLIGGTIDHYPTDRFVLASESTSTVEYNYGDPESPYFYEKIANWSARAVAGAGRWFRETSADDAARTALRRHRARARLQAKIQEWANNSAPRTWRKVKLFAEAKEALKETADNKARVERNISDLQKDLEGLRSGRITSAKSEAAQYYGLVTLRDVQIHLSDLQSTRLVRSQDIRNLVARYFGKLNPVAVYATVKAARAMHELSVAYEEGTGGDTPDDHQLMRAADACLRYFCNTSNLNNIRSGSVGTHIPGAFHRLTGKEFSDFFSERPLIAVTSTLRDDATIRVSVSNVAVDHRGRTYNLGTLRIIYTDVVPGLRDCHLPDLSGRHLAYALSEVPTPVRSLASPSQRYHLYPQPAYLTGAMLGLNGRNTLTEVVAAMRGNFHHIGNMALVVYQISGTSEEMTRGVWIVENAAPTDANYSINLSAVMEFERLAWAGHREYEGALRWALVDIALVHRSAFQAGTRELVGAIPALGNFSIAVYDLVTRAVARPRPAGSLPGYHSSKAYQRPLLGKDGKDSADIAAGLDTFVGVELEIEVNSGAPQSAAAYGQELADKFSAAYESYSKDTPERSVFFERDGSLSDGFELISSYGPIDTVRHCFMEVFKPNETGKLPYSKYLLSHNTTTCGLHVHLDAPKAPTHAARLISFWRSPENQKLINVVARRGRGKYNAPLSKSFDHAISDVRSLLKPKQAMESSEQYRNRMRKYLYSSMTATRYEVINTQSGKTFEVRAFKGTLNPVSIAACIEFAWATWQFARTNSNADMTTLKFLRFICRPEMREPTRNLRAFLATRGKSITNIAEMEPPKRYELADAVPEAQEA